MYQLVAIGDITIDLYFQGDDLTQVKDKFELQIGGKYYTDYFHQGLGGSAANVAIHAAEMGLDSAAAAKVGENVFKNMIVQGLIKRTVSTEFLYFEHKHISISSILLSKKGERTVLKYSDPKDHIELSKHALERIQRSEIVFMGNLPDVSLKERYEVLKAVRTESNIIAVNFGGKETENRLQSHDTFLSKVDILFLNRYEYASFVSKNADTLDLSKNQMKTLGVEIPLLVVTDGKDGSYAYTKDDVYHQKAESVKEVVDSTGAGDAFTAAFLKSFSEVRDIQKSLEFAAQYSAKILGKIGAN